jgi:hypothetical protein
MKALTLRILPKRRLQKWPKTEASPLQRLRTFLLRDLLPSLVMVIVLAFFAALVGKGIDQAKDSHSDRTAEISTHP